MVCLEFFAFCTSCDFTQSAPTFPWYNLYVSAGVFGGACYISPQIFYIVMMCVPIPPLTNFLTGGSVATINLRQKLLKIFLGVIFTERKKISKKKPIQLILNFQIWPEGGTILEQPENTSQA